ncbi:phytanoyl-CoA dioxygenase family protein [Candidatus Poribacteria bacterium]|jgi:phytanoyl-CoA hydroxylase|nr:phytanoyl-CoA dioxygenase family protein [Candidatus Poribacteria bacterium]MBT5531517.1 phytanoyl-CoA dioxygenase family protein [Candidatus Poribacteria bacterium]MBT5710163.1 phytanoyl-CoA dioxygenase family protein [Candidatus Poribacteria bacterium]MBT7101722.1 phytanoyl-CoA dioxygenase family protein [Candidatus Poribacteria bacterium]MBT7807922.1 phytanoyl-CoA dioxygenase family protein [Candidatus Poribacteria bacterium]
MSWIEQFREDGYTIVRGLIELDVRAAVVEECTALVDLLAERLVSDGKAPSTFADEPFDTRMIRLYEGRADETPTIFRPELHRADFFGLFGHPGLLDLAEAVLGPEVRLYPNYSARPKLPENDRTLVLWHQDAGYTASDADVLRMLNVWTPLVPATRENGCMEIVPGSHKRGVVRHEKDTYYLRIADEVIRPLEDEAVAIECDPGDVVLFSNLVFHRGLPNRSQHIRWSLDFRYQDATQPTMRAMNGHLVRSRLRPLEVVSGADAWASLSLR